MKRLRYFNICYHKNTINNVFCEFLSSNSNKTFDFEKEYELIDLINTNNIHIVITKYNFELLKQIRILNKKIQFIAVLDEINDTNLLESLELTQIKFIQDLDCINDFVDDLKDCINTIDSEKSNIHTFKNNFLYDSYNKTLFKEENIVSLSKKEISFLDFLFKNNNNKALSYEEINEEIWKGLMTPDALRSLIKEIRKKTYKELIKNVSGIGYRIDF